MGSAVTSRLRRTAVVLALAVGMMLALSAPAGAVGPPIVTGTVTDADTGMPIAGATVIAYDPSTFEFIVSASTDASGVYTFYSTLDNTAWQVDADGYQMASTSEPTPFGATTVRDFQLAPDISISGTVMLDDGQPAEGADVSVMWWDRFGTEIWYELAWTAAESNGEYEIRGLEGNGYPLTVWFSGYDQGRWRGEYFDNAYGLDMATIWESSAGQFFGPYASVDATLEAVAGIEGVVTDGANPIEGAIVALETRLDPEGFAGAVSVVTTDWSQVAQNTTGADGAYAFPGPDMPSGYEYRVRVSADKSLPFVSNPVSYVKGFSHQVIDAVLDPAPPLAFGHVWRGGTSEPMEGVAVYVADPQTGEHIGVAYTDSNGAYELPYLAEYGDLPFDFKFKAYLDGYDYTWMGSYTYDGTHSVETDFSMFRRERPVTRVAGSDRFAVAAALARKGWDPDGKNLWPGVSSIVIANGETGREADPLCAAPLAGALRAPVLLVKSTGLPLSTKNTIAAIAAKNPGVKIYLIGGTASVPDSVWASIRSIKGVSATKTRLAGPDRYATSVAIAKKVNALNLQPARSESGVMLVAGDNPAAFYDALAASPGAYAYRQPMLAVKKGSVPSVVKTALNTEFKTAKRYVVSSPTYISAATVAQAGGVSERLATSSNRYTAATQIATKMCEKGWVWEGETGLAASLPDALTGGAFFGKQRGVMLFTDSTTKMQVAPKTFITDHDAGIRKGWIIGGTRVVPDAVKNAFYAMMNPNG